MLISARQAALSIWSCSNAVILAFVSFIINPAINIVTEKRVIAMYLQIIAKVPFAGLVSVIVVVLSIDLVVARLQ